MEVGREPFRHMRCHGFRRKQVRNNVTVQAPRIRIRTRGSETTDERQAQPQCSAPAARQFFGFASQPALQESGYRPGAEHQQARHKAWVKVYPQNHEEGKNEERLAFANYGSPLEQKAEDAEEEPCEQVGPRKPVEGWSLRPLQDRSPQRPSPAQRTGAQYGIRSATSGKAAQDGMRRSRSGRARDREGHRGHH
jgi:hypothetical protein